MKLRRASQATSPLTVAMPLPRPNLLAEPFHRHLEAELIAGRDDVLETALVDRGEEPEGDRRSQVGWATKMPMVWASASTWRTPGMIG